VVRSQSVPRSKSVPPHNVPSQGRRSSERRVPRKLGPRDIGRIKYPEATKYEEDAGGFLEEKIDFHVNTEHFEKRKALHPVEKRQTVEEVGTPINWTKPDFYDEEVEKMEAAFESIGAEHWTQWEANYWGEKRLSVHNCKFDALKGVHLPRQSTVASLGTPTGWKPIDYELEDDGGSFLEDKAWYDSSKVVHDAALSKMINVLPPVQQMELSKLPPPTGYQSKMNFLRTLRSMVSSQVRRIKTENSIFEKWNRPELSPATSTKSMSAKSASTKSLSPKSKSTKSMTMTVKSMSSKSMSTKSMSTKSRSTKSMGSINISMSSEHLSEMDSLDLSEINEIAEDLQLEMAMNPSLRRAIEGSLEMSGYSEDNVVAAYPHHRQRNSNSRSISSRSSRRRMAMVQQVETGHPAEEAPGSISTDSMASMIILELGDDELYKALEILDFGNADF